ncbi:regulatory protein GemA [Aeromonas caviae]|uniref:gp16 family protein n=1 Tax=Aeromonas caviae TaxID=648 RepID=UPI002B491943|nr:regulatory protein GemA [Aeromonas caviae]
MDKRRRLIRLVQVGRRALALDEECYRDLLASHTGKRSAALLTEHELEQVLAAFKAAGFTPTPVRQSVSKRLSPSAGGHLKVNEIAKIRAIWCEMARLGTVRDGSETALNHWVQRMTARSNGGVGVAEVGWLDAPLAVKVLEALKKWNSRKSEY